MTRRTLSILAIGLAIFAPILAPTLAQAQRGAEPQPAPAIQGGPAPFDADLMRLSEILGALQYLRALCGANEGNKWRDQMTALLDAEAQSGDRRNRLVANFNNGFRNFQRSYRACTPAAAR